METLNESERLMVHKSMRGIKTKKPLSIDEVDKMISSKTGLSIKKAEEIRVLWRDIRYLAKLGKFGDFYSVPVSKTETFDYIVMLVNWLAPELLNIDLTVEVIKRMCGCSLYSLDKTIKSVNEMSHLI